MHLYTDLQAVDDVKLEAEDPVGVVVGLEQVLQLSTHRILFPYFYHRLTFVNLLGWCARPGGWWRGRGPSAGN